jgi:hypothetical protein
MKIHLIPTDKPSRLTKQGDDLEKIWLYTRPIDFRANEIYPQHIYITDNSEIKDCWILNTRTNEVYFLNGFYGIQPESKKIILTTDQDLIKDGVQAIDDKFLELFVKNPSCEYVQTLWTIPVYRIEKEYRIQIPKEKPKQETLEKAAINYAHNYFNMHETNNYQALKQGFENGAKSDVAKDYWYKKFWEDYESQFKNPNNEI